MFAKQNKKKVEESSAEDSDDEPMPSLPPDKRKGKGKVVAPPINKNPKGKVLLIRHCDCSMCSLHS